jgi:hypothetical protein
MEFREFIDLVRWDRVPPDAPVSGDVLTGGRTVPAGELRTYAILTGRPVPPPRALSREAGEPTLESTLQRIRWEPAIVVADRAAQAPGQDHGSGDT